MLRIKLQFIAVLVWLSLIFLLDVLFGASLDPFVPLLMLTISGVMFFQSELTHKDWRITFALVVAVHLVIYAGISAPRGTSFILSSMLVGGTAGLMYWAGETFT